jgi:hypothetical protein
VLLLEHHRISVLAGLFACAFVLGAAPALGSDVEADFGLPASLVMDATAEGCFNSPGPQITLSGTLTLGAVGGEVFLLSNSNADPKGQHKTDAKPVVLSVILKSESGEDIVVPKPPPDGGVGGNPWIFVQFLDEDGKAYHKKPILLGRCVQGGSANLLFALATHGSADVDAEGCSNNPGPYVTIDGALALGGLRARLILSNTRKLDSNGAHVNDDNVVIVEAVIKPAGEELRFHKQPPLGGAGGNPEVWFRFTDGDKGGYSDAVNLGRCVQLSK